MKTIVICLKSILIAITLTACEKKDLAFEDQSQANEPTPIAITPKSSDVIEISNSFGIDLFTSIAAAEDGNLMLAPLSASAALTMLLNGCEGNTYTQVRDLLGYPDNLDLDGINNVYRELVEQLLDADPKVTLTLANAMFFHNEFEVSPSFVDAMINDFDAHVEGLNFKQPSAVDTINKWASDNTKEKIPEVIQDIGDAIMYLMNALYFKGEWTYQFDESLTADMPFYMEDGNPIMVSTMVGNLNVITHYADSYQAVEIPYGGRSYSMVVVVPNEPLATFYEDFTPDVWAELTELLNDKTEWQELDVQMPRFSFDYEKVLNSQLQSMGMVDAFSEDFADLSGISEDVDLFVSMVKQNTFIEVNEEGTEAAAVTVVEIMPTSVGNPTLFEINRPFIFAIRERTSNTLLFIGSVVNPED